VKILALSGKIGRQVPCVTLPDISCRSTLEPTCLRRHTTRRQSDVSNRIENRKMFKLPSDALQYVASISSSALASRNTNASKPTWRQPTSSESPVVRDHVLAKLIEGECACLVHDGKDFDIRLCDGRLEGEIFHARVEDKDGNLTIVPMHPVQRFLYAELDTQRCIDPQNPVSHLFIKGDIDVQGVFRPASNTPYAGSKWYSMVERTDHLVSFYKGGLDGGGKIGTVRVSLVNSKPSTVLVSDGTMALLRGAGKVMQDVRALGLHRFANQIVDIIQSGGACRARFWMLYRQRGRAIGLHKKAFNPALKPDAPSRRLPLLQLAREIIATGGATCEEASVAVLAKCVAEGVTATHDVSIVTNEDASHIYPVIGNLDDPANAVVLDIWAQFPAPCTLEQYPYPPTRTCIQWKAGELRQKELDALQGFGTWAEKAPDDSAMAKYVQDDPTLKDEGLTIGRSFVDYIFRQEVQRRKNVIDDIAQISELQQRHDAATTNKEKQSYARALTRARENLALDQADQLRLELISINPNTTYLSPDTPEGLQFDQFPLHDWQEALQAPQELQQRKDLQGLEWIDLSPFSQLEISASSLGMHELDDEANAAYQEDAFRDSKRSKNLDLRDDSSHVTESIAAPIPAAQTATHTASAQSSASGMQADIDGILEIVAKNMPLAAREIKNNDSRQFINDYFANLIRENGGKYKGSIKDKVSRGCHFILALEEIDAACPLHVHFLKDPNVMGEWKSPDDMIRLGKVTNKSKSELKSFFQLVTNEATYLYASAREQRELQVDAHRRAHADMRTYLENNYGGSIKIISSTMTLLKFVLKKWEQNPPGFHWNPPLRNAVDFARNASALERKAYLDTFTANVRDIRRAYNKFVDWVADLTDDEARSYDAARSPDIDED
jgi:hypothetical protein